MSLQLHRIQDPRDMLERARRSELVEFARQKGVKEIVPEMPAMLMRKILRSRGLTNIAIDLRQLGEVTRNKINVKKSTAKPKPGARAPEPERVAVVDADDDLMRQWEAEQMQPQPPVESQPPARKPRKMKGPTPTDPKLMHMADLRSYAKKQGVSITFKMKKAEILQLLEVVNG